MAQVSATVHQPTNGHHHQNGQSSTGKSAVESKELAAQKAADMAKIATMRDVFDYCNKYDLISVAQGMIELPPPKKLRELVAADYLEDSHVIHQYGARIGAACYLDALVPFLKTVYGIDVPREAVMGCSGVSGGIVSTLLALRAQKRDRVAILEPFYTYHKRQAEAVLGFGTCNRFVECNMNDFSPNFEKIEAEFKKGLDAIIICNPCNPSGRIWKKDEMKKMVALCEHYNVVLIIDEIYCDMVWQGKHYSPIEDGLSKNVVVCRGWSKSVAAQSWRVGFLVTHPEFADAILQQHDPVYIALNCSQYGIAKYLANHVDDFQRHVELNGQVMKNNWLRLKKLFQDEFGWTPIEPEGSMYGLFYHHMDSDLDALKLGLDHGVGVAPGNMFFGGNQKNSKLIRIHYGFGAEAVTKIEQTVKAIKAQKASEKKP